MRLRKSGYISEFRPQFGKRRSAEDWHPILSVSGQSWSHTLSGALSNIMEKPVRYSASVCVLIGGCCICLGQFTARVGRSCLCRGLLTARVGV